MTLNPWWQRDRHADLVLDSPHRLGDSGQRQPLVLAGLEHDGPVAEGAGLLGASDDFIGVHAVAGDGAVVGTQPTVVALAQAVVRDLDETA